MTAPPAVVEGKFLVRCISTGGETYISRSDLTLYLLEEQKHANTTSVNEFLSRFMTQLLSGTNVPKP